MKRNCNDSALLTKGSELIKQDNGGKYDGRDSSCDYAAVRIGNPKTSTWSIWLRHAQVQRQGLVTEIVSRAYSGKGIQSSKAGTRP
jgi:hypothetical protein